MGVLGGDVGFCLGEGAYLAKGPLVTQPPPVPMGIRLRPVNVGPRMTGAWGSSRPLPDRLNSSPLNRIEFSGSLA